MSDISIHWADNHLRRFSGKIGLISTRWPKAIPRTINQVGNRAKTQVIRNLTKQTGLPRKTIVKAVGTPSPANPGKLSYEMVTRGGKIRLKYLSPREIRAGVSAKPFGRRTLYAGSFMKGGAFPNRKTVAKFNGHVFHRNGSGRNITFTKSDVVIPQEMTTGSTAQAFTNIAGPLLKTRIEALLRKLAP